MNWLRVTLHVSFAVVVLLLIAFSSKSASAHGGGIDGYGGHNDNKNGNYHSHQGNCAGRTFASKAEAVKLGCKRSRQVRSYRGAPLFRRAMPIAVLAVAKNR